MLTFQFSVTPFLLAMIAGLMAQPLNIYDVHAWNVGTVAAEPWRTKISGLAQRVTRLFARCVDFLWPHRQQIAAIACAVLVLLLAPSAHAGGVSICIVGHTVAQLETDLRAKQAEAKTLLETTMRACADTVVTAATATTPEVKGRVMTDAEKATIQAKLDEAKAIKLQLDGAQAPANFQAELERLTTGMQAAAREGNHERITRTLGAQFIADASYRKFIEQGGHKGSSAWTSPAVELQATTLDTTGGSGGALILPDYQPGIIPLLFKRLVVADLIAPGTTTSNLISFMKETTFTNAAATVAEGAAKPESALVFAAATAAVRKIAHWIPVTDEMLEDFAQTASIIDARLRLGLDLKEEDQLLNGDGIAPNVLGLMNLPGLTAAQARGADSNMDAIFKQMTAIATTIFVVVDGIVINPINWQAIQLLKNAAGNYMGSGPWAAAQTPILWGVPAAVTPSIVANTALVGAFRTCAQIFRRGGVRVESSNSHNDFFVKNLVAIRGEERLALAAYREPAFGKVTGLN